MSKIEDISLTSAETLFIDNSLSYTVAEKYLGAIYNKNLSLEYQISYTIDQVVNKYFNILFNNSFNGTVYITKEDIIYLVHKIFNLSSTNYDSFYNSSLVIEGSMVKTTCDLEKCSISLAISADDNTSSKPGYAYKINEDTAVAGGFRWDQSMNRYSGRNNECPEEDFHIPDRRKRCLHLLLRILDKSFVPVVSNIFLGGSTYDHQGTGGSVRRGTALEADDNLFHPEKALRKGILQDGEQHGYGTGVQGGIQCAAKRKIRGGNLPRFPSGAGSVLWLPEKTEQSGNRPATNHHRWYEGGII